MLNQTDGLEPNRGPFCLAVTEEPKRVSFYVREGSPSLLRPDLGFKHWLRQSSEVGYPISALCTLHSYGTGHPH